MDHIILNDGLHLAMEWGEEWLQPIQERLGSRHPALDRTELDRYDKACRAAMQHGHRLVRLCWHRPGTDEAAAVATFTEEMQKEYAWISDENLKSLYSQGMYYAWKNGDIPL